jgi:beta-1,2-mannobiose phosphorylase / 1,2-beta-oligomannan phosphorylase
MSDYQMQRLGLMLESQASNPYEVEGILNPAAVRGPDGSLYLFPRLVARDNYSRIGIAKVRFNQAGNPIGVQRMGIALEPEADYERLPNGGGGCEDPRVTFVEPLQRYLMTYTALSSQGPRVAVAQSRDLFHWERLGLVNFAGFQGIDFCNVANKDASFFPIAIPNHAGKMQLGLVHRPLFPGTTPEETVCQCPSPAGDKRLESIWISCCPMPAQDFQGPLGLFNSHHQLATPVAAWEELKIGGGTPPILTRQGWMMVYHGVSKMNKPDAGARKLCYSAGVMVLDRDHPRTILYRSPQPILTPELIEERLGIVTDVVFPTGIDRRDDLGYPDRFDIYYGMADSRIGAARLELSDLLPNGIAEVEASKVEAVSRL